MSSVIRSFLSQVRNGLAFLMFAAVCCSSASVGAQGYVPDEAAGKMTVANGFRVDLFAAEPHVRQPVSIEFDDRGRVENVRN